MSRVTLALSAAMLVAAATVPAHSVEVYLFKGAGDFSFINKNMHFSRGLDRIAKKLNNEGIRAEVRGFAQTSDALRAIKKRRPKSVAFVGHSMGALASMSMARQMRSLGIKVAYVGTLDIPGPVGAAGGNVGKAENYWSIAPIYGLLTNTGSHPDAKNIHVLGTHTTMDDSKKVFNGVVNAIRNIHAAEGGNGVPEPVEQPETIMVENSKPQTIRKPVVTASVAPLPKIDEVPEPVETSGQEFALANAGTAMNFDQRISFAHGDRPNKPDTGSGLETTASIGNDLMPVNLLAAPKTGSAAALQQIEPVARPEQVASIEPEASSQPGYIAPAKSAERRRRPIIDRGRITAAGRKLVSRISGLLKRSGKRYNRKKVAEVESQR